LFTRADPSIIGSIGEGAKTRRHVIKLFFSSPRQLNPADAFEYPTMDGPKDDLKWFGEGFDGFPKRLPEDCVEYTLYIIDSKLQDADVRARLRDVQTAATNLTKKLLKNYIWQRDGFGFELVREDGKVGLPTSFLTVLR